MLANGTRVNNAGRMQGDYKEGTQRTIKKEPYL